MNKLEREEMVTTLIGRAFLSCSDPRKPGIVVQRMLHKYGDKIKQLTSDDFKDVRIK
jgi:hypothetical protein